MSKVVGGHAVSVDGFITGRDPGPGRGLGDASMLFDWYGDGDVPSRVFDEFILHQVPVLLGAGRPTLPGAAEPRAAPASRSRPGAGRDPPPLRGGPMILVTGGLGTIGSQTSRALLDLGQEVVVTRRHHANVPSLPRRPGHRGTPRRDRPRRVPRPARAPRDHRSRAPRRRALEVIDDPMEPRVKTAGLLNASRRPAPGTSGGSPWPAASAPTWGGPRPAGTRGSTCPPPAGHPIPAFKKAAETLTAIAFANTDVQPVLLRIGTIWGPLADPDWPFIPFPALIYAAAKGLSCPSCTPTRAATAATAPTRVAPSRCS